MVACSTISFNHGMRFEAQDELATHYKMGKPLAGRLKVEWDEHRQRQASFAERPRSAEDCKSAQRGLLLQHLIRPNKSCEFGKNFGFSSIRSVSDYQHAVSVCDCEDLPDPILCIANGENNVLTSGPVRRFLKAVQCHLLNTYQSRRASFATNPELFRSSGIYSSKPTPALSGMA